MRHYSYKSDYKNLYFHPYKVFLFLLLAGITAMFLGLTAAYGYSRWSSENPPVIIPNIFIFNTLLLAASSLVLHYANICYKRDNTIGYQRALGIAIVLTLIFLFAQYFGWSQMIRSNLWLTDHRGPSVAYLYLLSGLHFVHVLAGIPFLILFLRSAIYRMKEPVSVLVYFSDPEKKLKLRLLTVYWHFLDGLWIYLILFFWIHQF